MAGNLAPGLITARIRFKKGRANGGGEVRGRVGEVDKIPETLNLGQSRRDNGQTATEVLVELDGIGGAGELIIEKRDQSGVPTGVVRRKGGMGQFAQKFNVGKTPEAVNPIILDAPYQGEPAVRVSSSRGGQGVDIEPVVESPGIAHDRAGRGGAGSDQKGG